jgi:hypothetical protein
LKDSDDGVLFSGIETTMNLTVVAVRIGREDHVDIVKPILQFNRSAISDKDRLLTGSVTNVTFGCCTDRGQERDREREREMREGKKYSEDTMALFSDMINWNKTIQNSLIGSS